MRGYVEAAMRNDLVARMARGESQSDIAREFGDTPYRLNRLIKKLGLSELYWSSRDVRSKKRAAKIKQGRQDSPSSRAVVMLERYKSGETLEVIGKDYGLSRERVRQIISQTFDVKGSDGGYRVKARLAKAIREAKRDANYIAKYGHDFNTHRAELRRDKGRSSHACSMHRHNANERNIKWEFNYASWLKFWRDSGFFEQRGRGIDRYVMCRFGDVGPYSPENCYIATGSDNIRHYQDRKNGRSNVYSAARE